MQTLDPQAELAARPQISLAQVPILFVYLGGVCLLLVVLVSLALLVEALVAVSAVLLISILLLVVVPALVLAGSIKDCRQ